MRPTKTRLHTTGLTLAAGALALAGTMASADQVINDDLIVTFSACIGNDCVNGENFGFDTLRLKENNLRIKFQDTSSSGSFPSNDWQIRINDSSNGGGNYYAVEDVSNARTPFRVDAGAPNDSLRVDSQGDVGLGTSNPVVDLHVKSGNTPTLRLEQDGSSGFTAQTFDIAANEANFFVRDVTNGSQLPFKIKPGADNNSLFIAANDNIGIGTDSPADGGSLAERLLEIKDTNDVRISIDSGDGAGKFGELLFQRDNADVFGVGADNSNFYIFGYDAGVNRNVLTINRTTGAITINADVTIASGFSLTDVP